MSKIIERRYTECGLSNIWIQCKCVTDDAGEKAYIIPNINGLHKVIARTVVCSDGALSGPEIKFLRSEMGWTQTQFGEIVHRTRLTISRWESGESTVDGVADAFIRILAIEKLKLKKVDAEVLSRKYDIARDAKKQIHIIGADSGRYRLAA